ncbi:redoxin domain-containing protein [Pedobacter sp. KBS0701]|uniref:TlpA family protein disulfide reductase n=1 Tax=Pedobacter sp. KBS0701 TaxID=2578106 RepID=UPI00110DA2EA|nr:thioredoxin domain-containing protein [Pedobacter sp. KBS0701]QDW27909.1 redoxin domain-containing protein [Pedobacter sp. KBS0701]
MKIQDIIKRLNILVFGLTLIAGIFCQANAQEKATKKLSLGDPAPKLTYSKWIQGPKPITKIDQDKVYVIEFWATWCGPCIAVMPHLSELAKKYEGKINFIGCNVWENMYGGPKDQETYLPKVTTFVNDQFKKGRLTYNVITDNTAEDMGNNWLKAAGQNGIPSSFAIQNGNIAWIGHPVYLDSILNAIDKGTYDYKVEKAKKEEQEIRNQKTSAGYTNAIKAYKAEETAKNYDKALKLMEEATVKFPNNSYLFATDKFNLLLKHYSVDKAIAYGKALQSDKLAGQVLIANLYKDDKLPVEVYKFAVEAVKGWGMSNYSKVFDILATLQMRAGQIKEAAESQQKAVDVAKGEKDNPGITEGVIQDYQKKADEYKLKAAGKI